MYLAFSWNKARGESDDSYGESSRTPHIKGSSPLKHDCEETRVGWGTLEPVSDLFPITKSRHTNMWFTSVNFYLVNGKNTSTWQNDETPRSRL